MLLCGWHHGGAVAQLLATLVGARAVSAAVRCVTFDAPRIASLELARLYACLVGCSYSVASGADPLLGSFLGRDRVSVCTLPRRAYGYVQHGRDPRCVQGCTRRLNSIFFPLLNEASAGGELDAASSCAAFRLGCRHLKGSICSLPKLCQK